jgi:hypothetical protein
MLKEANSYANQRQEVRKKSLCQLQCCNLLIYINASANEIAVYLTTPYDITENHNHPKNDLWQCFQARHMHGNACIKSEPEYHA